MRELRGCSSGFTLDWFCSCTNFLHNTLVPQGMGTKPCRGDGLGPPHSKVYAYEVSILDLLFVLPATQSDVWNFFVG